MKRRTLLKYGLTAGASTLIPSIALSDDSKYETIPYTKNDLDVDLVSDDVNDFSMWTDNVRKIIDIAPWKEEKPFLDILAYHRHIMKLSDRPLSESTTLDIADPIPQYRVIDSIEMANGWSITRRGRHTLFGDLIQNDIHHSNILLLGDADFNLTKNIRAFIGDREYGNVGNIIPIECTPGERVIVSYDRYDNFHYDEESGKVVNGVWTHQTYECDASVGILLAPVMGGR